MTPKITALAITLNEEENVKRYVQSLSFADEIIFIDSNSTDETVAIAKKMGVQVISRDFDDFSTQRNFAINQSKNDWIVFFDLDEYLTPKLQEEILTAVSSPNDCVAFYIKRNFFFLGKQIKFGGWQSDKAVRLFNKKHCSFNGNLVHESIITSGKKRLMKESVNHYSYKTYKSKLKLYSKLQAESLFIKKKRPNIYHFIIRPSYRFLWQYIFRLGFLDGKEGIVLAYLHAYSVYNRYLQLWKMYRRIE
ncbi:glycosyltransferase family 2 protein [Flavobacterium granuli]|uniref:Glycosyltransferase involved in cell wall biosynthesis n=1 Tax=Flavobacterium granuli TaxID=280093 RepID=A0ABU1S4X5_9FLAO|nr:glycosyltransferase family 2 protein [Flavobacterium granuli]MDR6846082.1 glycosyltransferase involved in cell wall biosynthesis [Flavobacterium granuli]